VVGKEVFEVMANWHVILAQELGEEGVKRWMRGELDEVRVRHVDMASAIWDFQWRLQDRNVR
jgi:hypothetical protein